MSARLLAPGVSPARRVCCFLMLCLALGTAPVASADAVYLAPEDFLREVFGTPPEPQVVWLGKDAQQSLSRVLGHPPRQARVRYWRSGTKTAWVLEEVGKEFPITAGFVVVNERIEQARVLIYRESRGMEVRYPSFLKQFQGAGLMKDETLSQPIDGISGATLSVRAMERMARMALFLNHMAQS